MSYELKKPNQILLDLGVGDGGPIQKELTLICYNKMFRYVPFSGDTQRIHLRENVSLTEDSITFKTAYAKYQYYGMREDGSREVRNYTTPGTGKYWDKLMLNVEKDNIIKELCAKYGGK